MMGLGINELGLISKGIFLPIQDRANDSQIFGTGAPLDGWGADTYVPITILLSRKKQFFIIKADAYKTKKRNRSLTLLAWSVIIGLRQLREDRFCFPLLYWFCSLCVAACSKWPHGKRTRHHWYCKIGLRCIGFKEKQV